MKLADMIPERAVFVIDGKEYWLREVTLADHAWIQHTFGNQIEIIFKEQKMVEIGKIIYRLLEDKSDFLPADISDFDDNGEAVKRRISGPERFLSRIKGPAKQLELFNALLKTIGISQPIMDELEKKTQSQIEADLVAS